MVTRSIDIQTLAMFADTEIGSMSTIFLAAFKIIINVHVQFFFVLLRGGLHLEETVMRDGDNFLADFTMHLPAAAMSFK
jgi:hypothetical protein